MMTLPDEILLPWRIISDSENAARLSAELRYELSSKHALSGLKTTAVANRIDRDEVLFNVEGGNAPFAVVHLSWRKESDPLWPSTKLFASLDEWIREEMLPANQEYGS